MDFLKSQGQKIREQLAGLTPSQKMLAGSLVVIMVMTLAWWSRYAGSSEMVALLEQDFSDESLSRATMLLKREQIPYKVVGKRVHVASDRQFEAIAALGYEQLLPQDTSSAWETIIEKMDSPWNPQSKQDQVFNHAKEVLLGQVLRAVKGIRKAQVVIDNQQKRSFGDDRREPTASVQITTDDGGGKSGKRLAEVAANVVAGAVSGMKRSSVHVIVDGASHTIHDAGEDTFAEGAQSIMEGIEWGERYYAEKMERHLHRINPGIMATVTVDPQITSRQIEKQESDKGKTFGKEVELNERTEENSTTSRAPAEPGAVPNVGANVGANQSLSVGAGGGGAGEGTSNSTTENKTKIQLFPSTVREWIKSPAGAIAVVGASISVPRSHFVRIFKQSYPDAKEPDDEALKPIVDKEMPSLRGIALGALPIDEKKVQMNVFYDCLPSGPPEAAAQASAATSFPLGAIRGYAKEIALGALAVMSLFMMSMMVRKGSPAAVAAPPAERERKPPAPIPAAEDVAGEAVEGDQTMEAVEIDGQAVKTQQMISQVQTMVRDNPDAAANLVKRWLNRA
jgi:flagellar M-ring protein FliF